MKKLRSITVNIHTSLYSARNCENESKAVERHVAADCSSVQGTMTTACRQHSKISTQRSDIFPSKEITQRTMPGARRRGRPRTAWMDNIKTWTGLSVEESIRMTEDRDKRRKYVHGVANPRIEDG